MQCDERREIIIHLTAIPAPAEKLFILLQALNSRAELTEKLLGFLLPEGPFLEVDVADLFEILVCLIEIVKDNRCDLGAKMRQFNGALLSNPFFPVGGMLTGGGVSYREAQNLPILLTEAVCKRRSTILIALFGHNGGVVQLLWPDVGRRQ